MVKPRMQPKNPEQGREKVNKYETKSKQNNNGSGKSFDSAQGNIRTSAHPHISTLIITSSVFLFDSCIAKALVFAVSRLP